MTFRATRRSGSIRDEDLHAYADGLLDGARRRRVEQHLAVHPDDAARIAAYRRINAELATLGRSHRPEELAPPLTVLREDLRDALVRQRQVRRTLSGAVVSVFVLAAASGTWMLSAWHSGGADGSFRTAAVDSAHPGRMAEESVEISASSEDEVLNWLSQQVKADRFSAPDLNSAGFSLAGARVVTLPDGPLVQILYDDDSRARLTFSAWRSEVALRGVGVEELSDQQLAVYWRQGSHVYSLVGTMQHEDLTVLADLIGGERPVKTKAAESAAATATAAPSPAGVVLIDSKAESGAPAASPNKDAPTAQPDESVKTPPATSAEKIEEPKPL